MLLFCPCCGNMLIVSRIPHAQEGPSRKDAGQNRFECRTCPYELVLDKIYYDRTVMKQKNVTDVLGGEGAWKNVDTTEVQCPDNCGNFRAYFYQLQIRSADEPMTSFYKCTKCEKQWKE